MTFIYYRKSKPNGESEQKTENLEYNVKIWQLSIHINSSQDYRLRIYLSKVIVGHNTLK